jgi:hypothetical protein
MPAAMSSRTFSGDSTAGPIVHTIFALRMALPYLFLKLWFSSETHGTNVIALNAFTISYFISYLISINFH